MSEEFKGEVKNHAVLRLNISATRLVSLKTLKTEVR